MGRMWVDGLDRLSPLPVPEVRRAADLVAALRAVAEQSA
jgi:hypothetical protein